MITIITLLVEPITKTTSILTIVINMQIAKNKANFRLLTLLKTLDIMFFLVIFPATHLAYVFSTIFIAISIIAVIYIDNIGFKDYDRIFKT